MRRTLRVLNLMIVVCTGFTSLTVADDRDENRRKEFDAIPLTSTWGIAIGGNISTLETQASWSPNEVGGVTIDFEEVLGLDEETSTWALRASYRFNPRHSFGFSATQVARSAGKTFDAEIEWGDYVFRADGGIDSTLDVSLVGLKWMYDLSDSGRLNTGISLGLSTFSISASLAGEARLSVDTGQDWVEGVVEGTDLIAPVPMVGFFLDYAMSPKWIARFHAEVVDLSISGHDGRVLQTILACQYSLTDLIAVGVEMNTMDLRYSTSRDGEVLSVDFSVNSLGANLAFSF